MTVDTNHIIAPDGSEVNRTIIYYKAAGITAGTVLTEADQATAANPLPFSGASTTVDGGNIVLGATIDASVATDTTGTISGKLRGIVALIATFAAKLAALPAALSTNGGLKVSNVDLIEGEDTTLHRLKTAPSYSFTNITAAAPTTTVVKSGAGIFRGLVINKLAASAVITMYDNTAASGTLIGTITLPAALLAEGPVAAAYDAAFATGLTIVTATGACDITVLYL